MWMFWLLCPPRCLVYHNFSFMKNTLIRKSNLFYPIFLKKASGFLLRTHDSVVEFLFKEPAVSHSRF